MELPGPDGPGNGAPQWTIGKTEHTENTMTTNGHVERLYGDENPYLAIIEPEPANGDPPIVGIVTPEAHLVTWDRCNIGWRLTIGNVPPGVDGNGPDGTPWAQQVQDCHPLGGPAHIEVYGSTLLRWRANLPTEATHDGWEHSVVSDDRALIQGAKPEFTTRIQALWDWFAATPEFADMCENLFPTPAASARDRLQRALHHATWRVTHTAKALDQAQHSHDAAQADVAELTAIAEQL